MRNAIACVVVLMFVPCTLYADPIGPTIGYWRFDEGVADATAIDDNSVLDSSGNGLHGTPVLEPVYRSDVPPSFPGNSLSMEFDGITGQRVVVPDHALFELTHSLTLEAFIKAQPMKPGTGGGADIILRGDARPGLDPYRLTLNQPGDTLVFAIVDENQNYADVQAPIPYDTWLHVAGTLDDATGAMKLYINGSEVASTITSIRPLGPLDPFSGPAVSIGEDPDGQYGEAFNGLIDEVRISNVALEPGQFLVPEPSLLCMLLPLLVGWGRRPARWGVNCTAPRKHSLRYGLHRVDGGGVACYKGAFLTERVRRSFDRKPLTLNPEPLRMSICERKKEIRRRRKRAEKLTKLKKRLPKATKSEQVEIARKVRDITPGAEVVIANWGLAAVDR